MRFVNISPLRSDLIEEVDAQWLAPRPSTDAALLLALAYEICSRDLHDKAFLAKKTPSGLMRSALT
ncbi:molybdopterin-dependent oxidoreductase [Lentibacter algarum]|nr:molybdopterin-dependent oxidoreductase [Lentibacter algarum]